MFRFSKNRIPKMISIEGHVVPIKEGVVVDDAGIQWKVKIDDQGDYVDIFAVILKITDAMADALQYLQPLGHKRHASGRSSSTQLAQLSFSHVCENQPISRYSCTKL